MSETAPLIYTWRSEASRLGWPSRIWGLAIAGAALGVFALALWIRPSADGVGSHRQLGLAACQFEERTGIPCPTCGMTTSFAYFARGSVVASFYVQPFAAILALATCCTFWGALYVGVTGRPAHRMLRFPASWYVVPLFTILILAWVWKIYIHLRGIDGWG